MSAHDDAGMAEKSWALILRNNGNVAAWRDYGDHAWGAATYEVLGYYTGRHSDALMMAVALVDEREGGAK